MAISMKTILASCLVLSWIVIAFMARECTYRERADRMAKQLDGLSAASASKDVEIERQARRIDTLNAEIEAANKASMAIDEIRTQTSETKGAIYEEVSKDKEAYGWYMERIPDSVQCILHERVCADGENRDEDRVCRSQ